MLQGKTCCRCKSPRLALAAEGKVIVSRCIVCTTFSVHCPQEGCNGHLRSEGVHRTRVRCSACNYTIQFQNKFDPI